MEILKIINPWWEGKKISKELAPPYKRKPFYNLLDLMDKRQILVLTGLRRVGKTTVMYQAIEHLLNKGIKAENILYFSFDEKIESPLAILKRYEEITKTNWKEENCYVFFDEVHKLKEWSSKIKILYDNLPNIKLIISGSSSFQLEKEAKSNLAGRHFLININPLTFKEYLELKESKIDLSRIELWKEEIIKEFNNYLLRPFPEIVNWKELSLIKTYIKDNIIEKIIRIDLPEKFRNMNEELLAGLIELFYDNPGLYINYDEISNDLKISKKTLLLHVYYLELAYLIRKIKNFRPSSRTTSKKLQRIYPYHFSLTFGWNGEINFESIVSSALNAKYYWRKNKKEVDFIILNRNRHIVPIEVKEKERVRKSELKDLMYFMNVYGINRGYLIYKGKEEELLFNQSIIEKIPIWKLFLNLEKLT